MKIISDMMNLSNCEYFPEVFDECWEKNYSTLQG